MEAGRIDNKCWIFTIFIFKRNFGSRLNKISDVLGGDLRVASKKKKKAGWEAREKNELKLRLSGREGGKDKEVFTK